MKPEYWLGIPLTLALTIPIQAQSPQEVRKLDEVIVTGTQTQRSLKNLPMIAQVISKKEIERVHPRSVADALQMTIPGVTVTVHGPQYRVSIQGLAGNHILFLMDGERITSEGEGIVDLNRIDMSTIDRIEVIRGAASALYGSNAIGAVINFITRQSTQPLQTSVSADYSGDGVRRYYGSVGLRRGGLSSLSSINHIDQEGYDLPDGTGTARVQGSRTYNFSEQLRFHNPSKTFDAKAYLRYSLRRQDNDPKLEYHYTSVSTGGQLYWAPSEGHSTTLSYNLERYDREKFFPLVSSSKEAYEPVFDYTGQTIRAQYNYGQDGEDRVLLNIGLEGFMESLRGDKFEDAHTKKYASQISFYNQADWSVTDRLSLQGGVRLDVHSRFKEYITPRLSALYRLGDWRLRASYSEGFRSPSLKELFMDWDHFGMFQIKGNKDVRPETSRMLSIAPEWQYKNINISFIASYNIINNRIGQRYEDNNRTVRYYNTSGTAKLWNLQTNLRWKLPLGFSLQMDYTYLNDPEKVRTTDGRRVASSNLRPHHLNGVLSYDKRWEDFSLSASYAFRYSSCVVVGIWDSEAEVYRPNHHEAYSISRLGLSLSWKRYIRLTFGVDNLWDYRVENINISSSLSPGRTFFAGLTINY